MKLTELEKEVLGLAKTLPPIPEDIKESLTWQCVWHDWDVNCHYSDTMTIGDVCGRFQVYRHYDVEMESHWEEICKQRPEEYPEWVDKYCDLTAVEWEDDDYNGEKVLGDDGKPLQFGMAFGNEREIYSEWGQHWLDPDTGEVVFIGKPDGDFYVGTDNQEWEIIRPEGKTKSWFDNFNDFYGAINHYDYRLHPTLAKRGVGMMDTRGLDAEYDCAEFSNWYQEMPWHERVMLPDLGLRKDGEKDEEKAEWERLYKIGGMGLLTSALGTSYGCDLFRRGKGSKLSEEIDDLTSACKIRKRNHYEPENEHDWFTLIHLLLRAGKDLHNAHYVCPKDLQSAIKTLRKSLDKDERQERERKEKRLMEEEIERYNNFGQEEEKAYEKSHGKYLKIEFVVNGIKYKVLQNVKAFLEQGIKMHYCIYHQKYFEHTDSVLLEATIDGKLIENIELDLLTGKVIEAHGARNTETPLHDSITEAVEANAKCFTDIYWKDAI